ncbi:MAG: hypothetical protein ACR2FO_08710 [Actinomycetota bacterium]
MRKQAPVQNFLLSLNEALLVSAARRRRILEEAAFHLEQSMAQMEGDASSKEGAASRAVNAFGHPHVIAAQFEPDLAGRVWGRVRSLLRWRADHPWLGSLAVLSPLSAALLLVWLARLSPRALGSTAPAPALLKLQLCLLLPLTGLGLRARMVRKADGAFLKQRILHYVSERPRMAVWLDHHAFLALSSIAGGICFRFVEIWPPEISGLHSIAHTVLPWLPFLGVLGFLSFRSSASNMHQVEPASASQRGAAGCISPASRGTTGDSALVTTFGWMSGFQVFATLLPMLYLWWYYDKAWTGISTWLSMGLAAVPAASVSWSRFQTRRSTWEYRNLVSGRIARYLIAAGEHPWLASILFVVSSSLIIASFVALGPEYRVARLMNDFSLQLALGAWLALFAILIGVVLWMQAFADIESRIRSGDL